MCGSLNTNQEANNISICKDCGFEFVKGRVYYSELGDLGKW